MKRLALIAAVVVPLLTFAVAHPYADVKTRSQLNMKFEGFLGFMLNRGKAAKEGLVNTAAVKGNRKATMSEDRGEIVDLGEEKVYTLDVKKKEYTVETFDQIRKRMREEAEKARKEMEKQEPQEKGEPQKPQKEYEVDFDVKDTGQKKQIIGYDTHETVVTITVREKGKTLEESGGIVMTNDMWMAPAIAELKELTDFDVRYWKALQEGSGVPSISPEQMAQLLAAFPLFSKAAERMQRDSSKLDGTTLESTTTVESVKGKDDTTQSQSGGGGGIGGMLGRKLMKKESKPRSTIMTMNHAYLEVAKSVDTADLAIPAGFKEVKEKK
jgi:hypothetical protein